MFPDLVLDKLYSHERMILNIIVSKKYDIIADIGKTRVVGKNLFGETSREFDENISEMLILELKNRGFEGSIVTEEKIEIGKNEERIFIDPVDGSINAARGVPIYCLEIGYATRSDFNALEFGLVWDIPRDEYYMGLRGRGCYKINARGRFSKIIAGRWDYDDTVIEIGNTSGDITEKLRKMGTLRKFGSIAFSMVKLAEGNIDAVFDVSGKLKLTDIAGALVILKESGVKYKVSIFDENINPRVGIIASTDKSLFQELLSLATEL